MLKQTEQSAERILLDLLGRSAQPLLRGGFEEFAACFHLPQTLTTSDGVRVIRTREELFDLFQDLRSYYQSIGLGMLTRQPVKTEFLNEHSIAAVHQTFVIGRQGLMRSPYEVFTVIHKKEGIWRASFSDYALGGDLQSCLNGRAGGGLNQSPEFNPPIVRSAGVGR